jgi:3-hydroxyacyl-[acyl-carrier-protein] dehydratase
LKAAPNWIDCGPKRKTLIAPKEKRSFRLYFNTNEESDMTTVMDVNDILNILPHRYPFMLVDRIIEMNVEEQRIIGYKNLTFNEPFFQGHFPDEAIMPGVMQLEAMAQVAGILLNKVGGKEGQIAYFMSIDKAKFRRKVVPGDTLRMEIQVTRMRSRMATVSAKAYVDDDLASQAELMFGYGAA